MAWKIACFCGAVYEVESEDRLTHEELACPHCGEGQKAWWEFTPPQNKLPRVIKIKREENGP